MQLFLFSFIYLFILLFYKFAFLKKEKFPLFALHTHLSCNSPYKVLLFVDITDIASYMFESIELEAIFNFRWSDWVIGMFFKEI